MEVCAIELSDQFLFPGNQARYGYLEHKISLELDPLQASLIFLFQARHPLRARVTSALRQSSLVSIYRTRVQIKLRFYLLRHSSSVFIYRSSQTLSSLVNSKFWVGGSDSCKEHKNVSTQMCANPFFFLWSGFFSVFQASSKIKDNFVCCCCCFYTLHAWRGGWVG